jgi:predicted SAM-dependent methyltransferase
MKVNLASGQRPFPAPWVNVDVKDQGYPVDIIADIKSMPSIPDESVDIAILHHVVEHIAIHELNEYITEWRRILKPGGRLAIFVPNLKELDKAWIEGRIETFIHNVNTYGAYQDSIHDLHKWGYDFQELQDRMSGKDNSTGNRTFEWSQMKELNVHEWKNDPIYHGSDCAFDWWILSAEFIK